MALLHGGDGTRNFLTLPKLSVKMIIIVKRKKYDTYYHKYRNVYKVLKNLIITYYPIGINEKERQQTGRSPL